MSIRTNYLSLKDLLANHLFYIPRYQRTYSWTNKERNDMFEDIRELRDKPEKSHFMATIVGLHRDRETKTIETDTYRMMEIVDGQQRLTTLVILLKAIKEELKSTEQGRKLQKLLVKSDDSILIRLNHDQNQYFANFLREGARPNIDSARTIEGRELLRTFRNCISFVRSWNNPTELLNIINNQLKFVFHEINEEEAVYTVFETLNDRGLPVSELDKLKSKFMSVVFENSQGDNAEYIDRLHQIWGTIYETIGLRKGLGVEALRFASTLLYYKKTARVRSEKDAALDLVRLVRQADNKIDKTIELSEWLLKIIGIIDKFEKIKPFRKTVVEFLQVRFLAVTIILRNLPDEEERKLLDQWEKTSFRIFGLCGETPKSKCVYDYVRLTWEIWDNQQLSANDILHKIYNLCKNYPPERVRECLSYVDCYNGWEEQLRYLLYQYEKHLEEQRYPKGQDIWTETADLSVEHILPQSSDQEGNDVHRLGNLLLLPGDINSQLSDKSPEEKAKVYRQTGLLSAIKVAETIENYGAWSVMLIHDREEELIDWILEEWS